MALVYKLTKLTNSGSNPAVPGDYLFKFEFHDFTLSNPPTLNGAMTIDKDQASTDTAIQDAIDAVLGGLGTNEMDWTK